MHSDIAAGQEAWYVAGMTNAGVLKTGAPAINQIHCQWMYISRDCRVDQIGIMITVSGGKGSVFRLGIYDSVAYNNWIPNNLIVDTGEQDGTIVGPTNVTINNQLYANQVYWFVYFPGVGTPTVRTMPAAASFSPFGVSNTFGGAVTNGLVSPQTYGALPSPIGTLLERTSDLIPAVYFRLST